MTSLTRRGGGNLTQRNIGPKGADGGKKVEDEENLSPEFDEEEKDYDPAEDSKEKRLTLMEEVLLLGLKDKEVRGSKLVFLILKCDFDLVYTLLKKMKGT